MLGAVLGKVTFECAGRREQKIRYSVSAGKLVGFFKSDSSNKGGTVVPGNPGTDGTFTIVTAASRKLAETWDSKGS
jgi:hypothetical protein